MPLFYFFSYRLYGLNFVENHGILLLITTVRTRLF